MHATGADGRATHQGRGGSKRPPLVRSRRNQGRR